MSNLFIFGLSTGSTIVRPAWTLAVELNWYLILFIGSMLSLRWVLIFLIANLLIPFAILYFSTEEIYSNGAGFAFALGALAFHIRLTPPKWLQIGSLVGLVILMYVIPVYARISSFNIIDPRISLCLIGAVLLLYLALPWIIKEGDVSNLSKLAGELSYPLFLIHFFAIYVSMRVFDLPRVGWETMIATTVIGLIASLLIVKFVEHPVAIIRANIRERNRKAIS